MNNHVANIEQARPSLIAKMAGEYKMEPKAFADAVRATCMPKDATNEEFAAFLMVAHSYRLNPVTREIFAFPKKGGGIQPIVSVDGWANLINSQPTCDGIEFKDQFDDKGELASITCLIHRKDRKVATMVTEYMVECKRPTEPWQKWPARMLRHKALIQCARYAFGFAGIVDQDEAERNPEVITTVMAPPPPPAPQLAAPVVDREPFDQAGFLHELEDQMATATDAESIEEVWTGLDVESVCDGDDDLRRLADTIRTRNTLRVHPATQAAVRNLGG